MVLEWTSSVRDLVQTAALVIAGIWTYLLFIRGRQRFPRASVTHRIEHSSLGHERILLSVTIGLSNQGVILLGVTEALLRIQQVSPVPDEMRGSIEQQPGPVESEDLELPWPVVGEKTRHWPKGEFEIEPGEADEVRFDFVIDGPVDTLRVYSYIRNVKKRGREIGWQLTTTYNLGTNEPTERTVEKLSGKERR